MRNRLRIKIKKGMIQTKSPMFTITVTNLLVILLITILGEIMMMTIMKVRLLPLMSKIFYLPIFLPMFSHQKEKENKMLKK